MATDDISEFNMWKKLPGKLSFDDTLKLLEQFQKHGDKDAWQKLVNGNLHLVRHAVSRLAPHYVNCQGPNYPSIDDLMSEGVMTLVNCINYYDLESKEYKFSTYLYESIKNTFKRIRRLGTEDRKVVSLNERPFNDDDADDSLERIENIPEKNSSFKGIHDKMDMHYVMTDIVPLLSKREREIFTEVAIKGKTLDRVGLDRNITSERVRQQYKNVLQRVRHLYFDGIKEEDYLTRGVKINDNMREQVKINNDLIKKYGRKFLLNEVIPTLKSSIKRKLATIGIIRYAGQNYNELCKEAGLVYDIHKVNFLKVDFKKYVEDFVNAKNNPERNEPKKQINKYYKNGLTKEYRRLMQYQKLIANKGGEMLLRKYFLPTLKPCTKTVFEKCVLEYEGGTMAAQFKNTGINSPVSAMSSYIKISLKKLENFNPADYEGLITTRQRQDEKFAQDLIQEFGRNLLTEYFSGLQTNACEFLTRSILKYDGSSVEVNAVRSNLDLQDAKMLLQNIKSDITSAYSSQTDSKTEMPAEKNSYSARVATRMANQGRQRQAKYAKLIEEKGGELFLRKYFLPSLPKGERNVFESAVLEYEGEPMGEIAKNLNIMQQNLSIIINRVIRKLENADFEKLVERIDNKLPVYARVDSSKELRRKKIVEQYGYAQLKKYFLPLLPKTQKQVFKQLYLSKTFPTALETARMLHSNLQIVLKAERDALSNLKSTDFIALAKVRKEAQEYLDSFKYGRNTRIKVEPTKIDIAKEYGGKEFLLAYSKELFHIEADRTIFEHVINGEDFDTIAKIIKPIQGKDTKRYCISKWANNIRPRLQKFKASFEDFDKAVEDFYAQHGLEQTKQSPDIKPKRKTRLSKGFSPEDIESYGGATHLLNDIMPTLKLTQQIVLLGLVKGQSRSEITAANNMYVSMFESARVSILTVLSHDNTNEKSGNDEAE